MTQRNKIRLRLSKGRWNGSKSGLITLVGGGGGGAGHRCICLKVTTYGFLLLVLTREDMDGKPCQTKIHLLYHRSQCTLFWSETLDSELALGRICHKSREHPSCSPGQSQSERYA